MLSHLNFTQVFFSPEIVKYLSLSDISNYRRVCKKSEKTKLELYYNSKKYKLHQIKEILPMTVEESTMQDDNSVYRYKNLFQDIVIKNSGNHSTGLKIDYWQDINNRIKQELVATGKRHYIYTHYIDIHDYYVHEFILAFRSREELLSFAMDVRQHLSEIVLTDNDIVHSSSIDTCVHCHYYGNNIVNYELTIYLDKNYKHCMIRDYGRRFNEDDD
jgi:hypothetical protein